MKTLAVSRGLLAVGVLLSLAASPASFAQSFTASNTTSVINTNGHTATLTLNTNGVAIGGAQLVLEYNGTHMTAASATSSDANLTCNVTVANRVSCGAFAPVANGTTVTISFNVGATAVPAPGSPLTFNTDPINGSFFLAPGDFSTIPTTLNNGSVTIITAPPNVILSYTPAAGSTITFPAGTALTTQNASITVTGGGTVGSGTVTICGITPAGATAFGAAPANITVAAGSTGTLPLTCTLPSSGGAASATLTCTETDSDSTAGVSRTWPLSCPQGTAAPVNPTIATTTPTGAFAMPTGAIGQAVTRQILFSATGGVGSGSATIACSGAAPLTVAPASQTVTGSNQPTPVSVSLPLTAAAQGPFAVTCTVTDAAGTRSDVFNVTAAAGAALPPPSVVPASSLWSQIALIALMAALGLGFVGFRRGQ